PGWRRMHDRRVRRSGSRRPRPGPLRPLGLPALVVVDEVLEADLLELGRRVERGAVLDAGVGGDGVQDRVALLLRATVRHGEDRVRPVLVRWALVAVGDPAEGGHPWTELRDAPVRHPADAHASRGAPAP